MRFYRSGAFTLCIRGCVIAAAIILAVTAGSNYAALGHSGRAAGTHRPERIAQAQAHHPSNAVNRNTIAAQFGAIPLSFEPNVGQTDQSVRFISHGAGYTVFLTAQNAVVTFEEQANKEAAELARMSPIKRKLFKMSSFYRLSPRFRHLRKVEAVNIHLANANEHPKIEALGKQPGTTNYFIGNDPLSWHTGIANYSRVKYESVYPGIDLVYYGNHRQLEFDFLVAPGANPRSIKLDVQSKHLRIAKSGALLVSSGETAMELHRPNAYQIIGGKKIAIPSRC